jgi:hypothetical protein
MEIFRLSVLNRGYRLILDRRESRHPPLSDLTGEVRHLRSLERPMLAPVGRNLRL